MPAADAAPHDPQAGVTRTDADPGLTRVEPPADRARPVRVLVPARAAGRPQRRRLDLAADQDGERHARSGGGIPASGFTVGNPFSSANPAHAARPALPARSAAGRAATRGAAGGACSCVLAVIVVLAAGGGAYALATTLGKHSTAQPSAGASTSAAGSPAGGGDAAGELARHRGERERDAVADAEPGGHFPRSARERRPAAGGDAAQPLLPRDQHPQLRGVRGHAQPGRAGEADPVGIQFRATPRRPTRG